MATEIEQASVSPKSFSMSSIPSTMIESMDAGSLLKDSESSLEDPTSTISLKEDSDDEDDIRLENQEYRQVVAFVEEQYHRAKTKRQADERRWLEAYRNYRGLYGPDVQFSDREKSRAFVKITKTKVFAAYAKVSDVLFSGNKFPIGIENTPVPDGIEDSIYFDPKEQEGEEEPEVLEINTITRPSLLEQIGPIRETVSRIPDAENKVKEGPGKTPSSFTWEPAKAAARKMEKQIHDQLLESNAAKHLRSFAFEMCLFGTGIMKGPMARNKEYPRWTEDGQYSPLIKLIPESKHVSVWDIYPDPDARSMDEAESMIERHRMSKTDLRNLKSRPHFRRESIELAIEAGTDYHNEYWEDTLKDYETTYPSINRYEVLEYWGVVDKKLAEQLDVEIPEEIEDLDEIQVNIWICNGFLLRFVLNPFTPARIPYYACPYEVNPYSFFGVGIAENMSDTQLIMNGFMRLAVDNAALSSNLVFEVDETNLVPGQNMEVYPGKIFRRQSGAPGQAIFGTKFPNITQECLLMFDKARQISDEATGMPSYAHGMSGIMNTGRTASGMSMLMGAADLNIKAVVRNIDDYLLIPWGKGMFLFNMQFNFDKEFIGDLDVVARGTESLMRNEIRSQKLLQFLQLTSNPLDAPFVKRDYILRELAQSLDLDAEKIVNDPREAGVQAAMIAEMQKTMGPIDGNGQNGNPASVPGLDDGTGTGGGNIAPGMAPEPGSEGFTGQGGGANSTSSQSANAEQANSASA